MEDTIAISLVVGLLFLAIAGIGYNKKKKADAVAKIATDDLLRQYSQAETLGQITYHGGFPPRPKPAILQLAVDTSGLILYDYQGWSDKVLVRDWQIIEKFTVQKKAKYIVGTVTLLGPLAPLFFRDTYKFFITVKYSDIDREDNYLVFEAANAKEQEQIYAKLDFVYKK